VVSYSSLEDQLEIALITYNRSEHLEKTLGQLAQSPFSRVKFTLYDNHSSDDTEKVCQRYADRFPKLKIVRHDKNIGGGPNFLRAIELSTSAYTWVLCDDDDYDFSDCSDVIASVRDGVCDIIWVSDEHLESWERGLVTTADVLMKQGARYYPALSFVPSIIFKTELFDGDCLEQGYRFYEYLYPQFPFIHKSFTNRFSVYVALTPIITRGWGSTGVSPFSQYAAWCKCALSITDRKLRARVIEDMTGAGGGLLKELFALVGCERLDFSRNRKRFWKDAILLWLSYSLKQRLYFLAAFISGMLLPLSFLGFLRKMNYRLRGLPYIEKEFDPRDVYEN